MMNGRINGQLGCAETRDKSPLEQAFDEMRNSSHRLNDVAGELAARLEPVLSPSPPDEGKLCGDTSSCQYGHWLSEETTRNNLLRDRLADILSRLCI